MMSTMISKKNILIYALITPLLATIILPIIISRGLLRFDNTGKEWASIATKDEILLINVFPEEIKLKLWQTDHLFKIDNKYYRIGVKHAFIGRRLMTLYFITLVIMIVGGFITYLLLSKSIKALQRPIEKTE